MALDSDILSADGQVIRANPVTSPNTSGPAKLPVNFITKADGVTAVDFALETGGNLATIASRLPDLVVTATGTITVANATPTGTATANSAVEIALNGGNVVGFVLSGAAWSTTPLYQVSMDGTLWTTINPSGLAFISTVLAANQTSPGTNQGGNGQYEIRNLGPYAKFRISGSGATTGALGIFLRVNANSTTSEWVKTGQGSTMQLIASAVQVGDVGLAPRSTANGLAAVRVVTAATVNAALVKASIGRVFKITLSNTTSAAKFIKFYNSATAVTPPAITNIVVTYAIPALSVLDIDFPMGRSFATGIAYAITGAATDTDATVTAVNDVTGEILYA